MAKRENPFKGTPFEREEVKITPKNNISEHRNKGLWHVIQNGDPTYPVRECVIETVSGVHITSLGPSTPISLADAQWMCILNNKAEQINALHGSLLDYFSKVESYLKKNKAPTETVQKITAYIKALKSIYV